MSERCNRQLFIVLRAEAEYQHEQRNIKTMAARRARVKAKRILEYLECGVCYILALFLAIFGFDVLLVR